MKIPIPTDNRPLPVERKKYKKRVKTPEDLIKTLDISQVYMLRELALEKYNESKVEVYQDLFCILNDILDELEDI